MYKRQGLKEGRSITLNDKDILISNKTYGQYVDDVGEMCIRDSPSITDKSLISFRWLLEISLGISRTFARLSPSGVQVGYALLTRAPVSYTHLPVRTETGFKDLIHFTMAGTERRSLA